MYKVLVFSITFSFFNMGFVGGLSAGEVPYSALVSDYKGCLKTSKTLASIKESYCMCVAIGLHKLTMKEYLALNARVISKMDAQGQISREKALSIKRVRIVATNCMEEISNQM